MNCYKQNWPLAPVKYTCAATVLVAFTAAQAQFIVVASTTSTEQSGLFASLARR